MGDGQRLHQLRAGRPADGNGNGFKIGSSKTGIRHVVRNCLAWGNRATGFYANHSSGGNDWFNNTSYNNGTQYNMLASTWDADGNRTDGVILTGDKVHRMRNNIGFPNNNTQHGRRRHARSTRGTWASRRRNGDFVSVTTPASWDRASRTAACPNLDFMKLRAGSR